MEQQAAGDGELTITVCSECPAVGTAVVAACSHFCPAVTFAEGTACSDACSGSGAAACRGACTIAFVGLQCKFRACKDVVCFRILLCQGDAHSLIVNLDSGLRIIQCSTLILTDEIASCGADDTVDLSTILCHMEYYLRVRLVPVSCCGFFQLIGMSGDKALYRQQQFSVVCGDLQFLA